MFDSIKDILFLDFETYYAQTYSLGSKAGALTIPEYLLDPRYETICCATAVNGAPSVVVDGPDFDEWISKFNPETTATVTFNALFDNSILAWHHGWVPRLMLDSMNMARALRGHLLPKLNLKTCCEVLLPTRRKLDTISKVINMRRAAIINNGLWPEFCHYANADNEASRDIFKLLIGEFPFSEQKLMDLVIRCTVQPRFMLDRAHLAGHLATVQAQKDKLLIACGADPVELAKARNTNYDAVKAVITKTGIMSTVGFTKALETFGVEIQTKIRLTGKNIPAFAKTDAFMKELQEHPDTRVQALACARLGVKSTLEETRTEKLIAISKLPWDRYRDGNPRLYSGGEMPVPLRYAGAHTHRLSGDWRLNMQNMPRGAPGKPPMLRQSLLAPLGHVVVTGDLSQIEARLVAWLAGATKLLEEFARKGGDPYSAFASMIFGFPVDRKYVDPATGLKPHAIHGFVGKTGVLGLGYQCGVEKFYNMVETLARLQGIKLEDVIPWTKELAEKTVYAYRRNYWQIPKLWELLQQATRTVWLQPGNGFMNIGPITIRYGEIEGPNGLSMLYHNTRLELGEYKYTYGYSTVKMYGGKMLENIIQFLARIIIMNTALRMSDLGYNFVLQAHDELVYIVHQVDEQKVKALLYKELTRPPSWGRDIPLDAEVHSGPSYGDAK